MDTGFKDPTNTGEDFNQWNNPANAYTSNNQYATDTPHAPPIDDDIEVSLSHDGGVNYTAAKIATFVIVENTYTLGGPADLWGRAWAVGEFSNVNFRLKVEGESSSDKQDYYDFTFGLPGGAVIDGIEVTVEGKNIVGGRPPQATLYLDHVQVKVYYHVEAPPVYTRPPSVRLRGPLFSLTARGWLGGYTYFHRGFCTVPYPIALLPRIREPYFMPAFSLRPYPSFISQYYSASGWIYQRRRTWHGITWIAMAGYTTPNPRTAPQQAWRSKFAGAVSAWQALTNLQKGVWNSYNYPKHCAGYHRFIRAYLLDKPH